MAEVNTEALRGLSNFNVHARTANLADLWVQWRSSLEIYLVAANITGDERKKAVLLHTAGREVQKIVRALTDDRNADDGELSYNDVITLLNTHFGRQKNLTIEKWKFSLMTQLPGETVSQWVCRLRPKANLCGFGDTKEQRIIELVVHTCQPKLRALYLAKWDLTMTQLLEVAYEYETLQAIHSMENAQINTPQKEQVKSKIICYGCGKPGHMKYNKQCPAKYKPCEQCGRKGHVKEKCYAKEPKKQPRTNKSKRTEVNLAEQVKLVNDTKTKNFVFFTKSRD
ncbi:uncharacterized protein LOC113475438 [Ciona intestinalis]